MKISMQYVSFQYFQFAVSCIPPVSQNNSVVSSQRARFRSSSTANSYVLPTSCTWPSGQHADRSLSGEYMFIQSLILMIVIQEAHQSFYFNKKIVRKYIFNYKSADNQVILTRPVTFDSLFGIMFYNVIRYWSPGLRGCSNLRLVLYYRNNSTFCVILDERGVV